MEMVCITPRFVHEHPISQAHLTSHQGHDGLAPPPGGHRIRVVAGHLSAMGKQLHSWIQVHGLMPWLRSYCAACRRSPWRSARLAAGGGCAPPMQQLLLVLKCWLLGCAVRRHSGWTIGAPASPPLPLPRSIARCKVHTAQSVDVVMSGASTAPTQLAALMCALHVCVAAAAL